MKHNLRAAIFDLGGTLLEFNPRGLSWMEWERTGLMNAHAFLTARGHTLDLGQLAPLFSSTLPVRWEWAARGVQNLKLGDMLRESCAACGVTLADEDLDEAVAQYIAPVDRDVRVYEDAVETLGSLRERGLKIGLISNTMWPGDYHLREMARFGLLPYFDHTLFSADVGLWKPQPEVYYLALGALGVSAENAFFVGDTPQHDIVGAQAAGIRAVFKRNASFGLDGVQPDAEITTLSELLDLVEQWA